MNQELDRIRAALADRYHIEGEVGAGGMAVVYAAQDLKHDRRVAIKVLRPELSAVLGPERFDREVRIAARLTHPNILPLFDSGAASGLLYYVMPFVAGESLADKLRREGALPLKEALRIIREAAAALEYAHGQGVIHRDIKPENILLFQGVAMVADFGVAMAVSAAGPERITHSGMAVGTPAYMSPEQAAADMVDARSDVYALACVLYHMLVGDPPFRGPTPMAVMARHALDPVPSIRTVRQGVPPELETAVIKALAKMPADRFGSVAEFAAAIDATPVPSGTAVTSAPASAPIPAPEGSIAVMPFTNLSADPENEYFCDGMTEEIINSLSQLPGLNVAARSSVFSFKGVGVDARVVAEKLGVRLVLEGSVRKAGTKLRITTQLVNAVDGFQVWSERFDRQMEDVFEVQDEIARSIAKTLQVHVTSGAGTRAFRRGTNDLQAYDLYLKGRHLWNQRALPKSMEYFQRAVERDPNYAFGHAGLADGFSFLAYYGYVPAGVALHKGRAAAERAVLCDPMLPEAHYSLGLFEFIVGWNMEVAGRALRRAVEIRPSLAQAQATLCQWYGVFGEPREAEKAGSAAIQLEPLNPLMRATVGYSYTWIDRSADAVRLCEEALELEPNALAAQWVLGVALGEVGRADEAVTAYERAVGMAPGNSFMRMLLGGGLAQAGRGDEALVLAGELEAAGADQVSPSYPAWIHGQLGDVDRAIGLLSEAFPGHASQCLMPSQLRSAAPVFHDARYQALLKEHGLSDMLAARTPFQSP